MYPRGVGYSWNMDAEQSPGPKGQAKAGEAWSQTASPLHVVSIVASSVACSPSLWWAAVCIPDGAAQRRRLRVCWTSAACDALQHGSIRVPRAALQACFEIGCGASDEGVKELSQAWPRWMYGGGETRWLVEFDAKEAERIEDVFIRTAGVR